MKAPRSKSRRPVSTKSKIAINSNYLLILFAIGCLFAAFQCDAQNIVAPCHLYGLHISWIYRYPKAILCLMSRNITEFFRRIILSPIYLLNLILCFSKTFIFPFLSWLYSSFFAPIIKLFEGIRYTIKSLALALPHLFIIPLYIIKFLLYPLRFLISLISPYCYTECNDNPLKCIGHQTARIFYIPIRAADGIVRTVDEWIQILLDQIYGPKTDENIVDDSNNQSLIQEEERKRLEEEERRRKQQEEEEERRKKQQEEEEERRKKQQQEEEEERRKKYRVNKEDYKEFIDRIKKVEDAAERANDFVHKKLHCTKDNCNDD